MNKLCRATIVTRVKNQEGTDFTSSPAKGEINTTPIANLAGVSRRLLINLCLAFQYRKINFYNLFL